MKRIFLFAVAGSCLTASLSGAAPNLYSLDLTALNLDAVELKSTDYRLVSLKVGAEARAVKNPSCAAGITSAESKISVVRFSCAGATISGLHEALEKASHTLQASQRGCTEERNLIIRMTFEEVGAATKATRIVEVPWSLRSGATLRGKRVVSTIDKDLPALILGDPQRCG